MAKYYVHFYKVDDLSPDEEAARRKNQSGVWIDMGGVFEAASKSEAISRCRKDAGPSYSDFKMRAVEK